jgi:hypothetical protein
VLPTPTDAPSRAQRLSRAELLRTPTLVGAAGSGALGLLHVRDPHASGSYGFCPFLLVTGQPCPGCGGLRAMNELTHGDVVGALSSNAMAVVLLVVMGAAWAVWFVRRWRGRSVPLLSGRSPILWGLVVAFILFGVVRWTPWGEWLRP